VLNTLATSMTLSTLDDLARKGGELSWRDIENYGPKMMVARWVFRYTGHSDGSTYKWLRDYTNDAGEIIDANGGSVPYLVASGEHLMSLIGDLQKDKVGRKILSGLKLRNVGYLTENTIQTFMYIYGASAMSGHPLFGKGGAGGGHGGIHGGQQGGPPFNGGPGGGIGGGQIGGPPFGAPGAKGLKGKIGPTGQNKINKKRAKQFDSTRSKRSRYDQLNALRAQFA
jgi:hypothetical protein